MVQNSFSGVFLKTLKTNTIKRKANMEHVTSAIRDSCNKNSGPAVICFLKMNSTQQQKETCRDQNHPDCKMDFKKEYAKQNQSLRYILRITQFAQRKQQKKNIS